MNVILSFFTDCSDTFSATNAPTARVRIISSRELRSTSVSVLHFLCFVFCLQQLQGGENPQYAAVNNVKQNMSGGAKENFSECVYSTVRQ